MRPQLRVCAAASTMHHSTLSMFFRLGRVLHWTATHLFYSKARRRGPTPGIPTLWGFPAKVQIGLVLVWPTREILVSTACRGGYNPLAPH